MHRAVADLSAARGWSVGYFPEGCSTVRDPGRLGQRWQGHETPTERPLVPGTAQVSDFSNCLLTLYVVTVPVYHPSTQALSSMQYICLV